MSNDESYAWDDQPLEFDYSMLDQQPEMDPYIAELIATLLQPPMDKYGNLEPIDLAAQNTMQTGLQSRYRTLFDMGNTMLTGGYAPGAFNPIRTEKQLDFPKSGALAVQARSGGYQGKLAELIMRGMSPAQAAATIQQVIDDQPDNITDEERNQLMMGLPMLDAMDGGGVDWNSVQKEAASMAGPYWEEQGIMERALMPESGIIQRDGKFYQVTETPSPATEWLQKQGFDNPNTQYNEDYVRQNNPEFAGIEAALSANFGDLNRERLAYEVGEGERNRSAALERRFMTQDRDAMDRYSRDVQNAMGDYRTGINRDFLTTPAYGGGQHVGDPTAIPQLGGRTGSQLARDQALDLSLRPLESMGQLEPGGSSQRSIRQALADYMSQSSREPMTDVAGHPARQMVGGGARGIEMGLPEMPTLSAYSPQGEDEAARLAMANRIMGMLPMGATRARNDRVKLENAGRVRPERSTGRQEDATRRANAKGRTKAAQWAYAQAMLPAYIARMNGRTPFQDQVAARAQSMYALGSIGR